MRTEKIKVLNILKDSYTCVNFEDAEQTHECVSNGFQEYLNDPDVRNSLHVSPKSMHWKEVNNFIVQTFVTNYYNMREQFKVINRAKLKTIVYNGDIDLVCNFIGDQMFLDSLNIPIFTESTNWFYNGILAGSVKYFANNLTFTTVRGAGHAAPKDKPGPTLEIFKVLLGKAVFNSSQDFRKFKNSSLESKLSIETRNSRLSKLKLNDL
jgi:carboxypeptidase C (cathepsin A)